MTHTLTKAITALTLAVASFLPANAQDAFFVYRNDGQFNAFFNDEIDSIVCSNIDLDSIVHEEFVVQEFHTPDSIYRIPIASIDSVGFQKPETIYRPGVTELSGDLRSHILSVDGMTIYFDSSTPTDLLPKAGDKLTTTEVSKVFTAGFAGEVSDIKNLTDSIAVTCDSISLKEIYERYFGVYKYSYGDSYELKTRGTYIDNPKIVTIEDEVDLSPFLEFYDNASYKDVGIQIDKGLYSYELETPKATLSIAHIEGIGNTPNWIRVVLINNHRLNNHLEAAGSISVSKDIGKNILPIPLAGPYVKFLFEPGACASASGEFIFKFATTHCFKTIISYEHDFKQNAINPFYRPDMLLKPVFISNELDPSSFISGKTKFMIGGYLKIGLAILHEDILNIYWRYDKGVSVSSNFMFSEDDIKNLDLGNSVYTELKTKSITLESYSSHKVGFEIANTFDFSNSFAPKAEEWLKVGYVPVFNDISCTRKDPTTGQVVISAQLENSVLVPLEVGIKLYDSNNNVVDVLYNKNPYGGWSNPFTFNNYYIEFNNLVTNEKYTAYPVIKMFGKDMLASPKLEFTLEGTIQTLSSTCTYKSAVLNGYVEGEENFTSISTYGFIYGTSPTLTDKSGTMIAAAGNTDGNFAVAIDGLSEETTYYYRAYMCIDGNYSYGETLSFTTPEKPEMGEEVDLGLSVNWRGWNVGATKPEECGNYFAWGETSQKDNYTWQTYFENPYDDNDEWIGSATATDVAGTDKDAATVILGEKWRMPTYEEVKELMEKCSWTWSDYNGVKGYTVESNVAGYEGNFIFLPAAGNYDKTSIKQEGSYGGYWSSTPLDSESKSAAYIFYFYGETIHSTQSSNRYTGRTIRPVTPKEDQ